VPVVEEPVVEEPVVEEPVVEEPVVEEPVVEEPVDTTTDGHDHKTTDVSDDTTSEDGFISILAAETCTVNGVETSDTIIILGPGMTP
jgi:hypothetical protein